MRMPLFKVIEDGHEYAVYPDGQISGFNVDVESLIVVNNYPLFVRMEREIESGRMSAAEYEAMVAGAAQR